ncbi:unnamed protein product [Arabidopsis arenosa]|uniref:Uncharacterized protein n=1 Tax=Arabidopsis arenosa TaxID=38785 RepID=A0A8S2APA6_ARAAE|nr:unnamed protein product [Arabidopsis arenosa]
MANRTVEVASTADESSVLKYYGVSSAEFTDTPERDFPRLLDLLNLEKILGTRKEEFFNHGALWLLFFLRSLILPSLLLSCLLIAGCGGGFMLKSIGKNSDSDGQSTLRFDLGMILVATDEFSPENKLGQGGFGSVYKGILPSGQEIAVKRLAGDEDKRWLLTWDVSFGVMLLEMISGEKNKNFETEGLPAFAWKRWIEGELESIIDPYLNENPRNEIIKLIQIGLLCVQENAAKRPTMNSVIAWLARDGAFNIPKPTEAAFVTLPLSVKPANGSMNKLKDKDPFSVDEVSITVLYPR